MVFCARKVGTVLKSLSSKILGVLADVVFIAKAEEYK